MLVSPRRFSEDGEELREADIIMHHTATETDADGTTTQTEDFAAFSLDLDHERDPIEVYKCIFGVNIDGVEGQSNLLRHWVSEIVYPIRGAQQDSNHPSPDASPGTVS